MKSYVCRPVECALGELEQKMVPTETKGKHHINTSERLERHDAKMAGKMFTQKDTFSKKIIILLLLVVAASAFVPPHQDWGDEEWQSVEEHRKQNRIEFGYKPHSVHPEICRHADEIKCAELDESFARHVSSQRRLVDSGKLRVLVLLLQWEDHPSDGLIDPSDFEMLWNEDMKSDIAPSGSIASFIRLNSYGKLHIEADIIPWMKTKGTESFFSNSTAGLPVDSDLRPAIEPLLEELDRLGFDWSRYDQDSDGLIDSLVVLHSGYAAELGLRDCDTGKDFSSRIWSHSQGPKENSWKSRKQEVGLGGYTISSAFRGVCGKKIARIGVILHELLHSMGLPYLHDLSMPQLKGGTMGGAGYYDIMSNPYGPSKDAMFPGILSPWSKIQMGWLRPFEIPYDGIYLAGTSAVVDQIYKISKGYADGEYLLIENRQAVLFDSGLPSEAGLLIWHIDDSRLGNSNPGFPGQRPAENSEPSWPMNGRHYQVALLQADGLYELEKGINNGDRRDFWTEGMTLQPSASMANSTFPNTDSYALGQPVNTGFSIKVLSRRLRGRKCDSKSLVLGIGIWGLPRLGKRKTLWM